MYAVAHQRSCLRRNQKLMPLHFPVWHERRYNVTPPSLMGNVFDYFMQFLSENNSTKILNFRILQLIKNCAVNTLQIFFFKLENDGVCNVFTFAIFL